MKAQIRMLFEQLKPIILWSSGIFLVIILAAAAYSAADESGYISHSVETSISAQENWLIGEAKECTSPVLNAKTAHYIGQEDGYVAVFVTCDNGPQHAIKVTFYGQLNQPDHKLITWRCTRESEGFTCKQKGSE
jgi:hypothetical protein